MYVSVKLGPHSDLFQLEATNHDHFKQAKNLHCHFINALSIAIRATK